MLKKKIECFVPAQALEHPKNNSNFSRIDKIRAAVRRYDITDDFFEDTGESTSLSFIVLEKVEFKPKELGYWVIALVI